MPELPEAETIARGLRPHLPGRRIESVQVVHSDVLTDPDADPCAALAGATFDSVERRGKNLVLVLDDGRRVVVNLGMTGRLLLRTTHDASEAPSHPALRFLLDRADHLVFHDVRRFGRITIHDEAGYREWSATLGPEPLGEAFTVGGLAEGMRHSRTPLRSWLLDQRRVAGVGNIYANEAAFVSGLHPRTPVRTIPEDAFPRLHHAVRLVLREAVTARGTTLRDYRTAAGDEGGYAGRLRVYGRAGAPCPRCATPVERTVFSNRSAFFCPRCQPPPDTD